MQAPPSKEEEIAKTHNLMRFENPRNNLTFETFLVFKFVKTFSCERCYIENNWVT